MLLVSDIRENQDTFIKALEKRGFHAKDVFNKILDLDESRRNTQAKLDDTLAQLNTLSKQIGRFFKEGNVQEAEAAKAQTSSLKEDTKILQQTLDSCITNLQEALLQVPNIPHESVPEGKDDTDNDTVYESGTIPQKSTFALPHWELAKKHDLIDFELGVKLTGAGFPVYKGKGARLQRALISFFLDQNTAAGYTEYQVPHLVNTDSAQGTGQLPDKEGQMYHVTGDDLYLIPTAEVPITNIFRNQLLTHTQLPICSTGYTPCFRREAGSYGAHVRGLNRLHQFDKVEIVHIEHPEKSYEALDSMVQHVKKLLEKLNLPFRILRLCGGDLGFTSALTFDFEVYSSAQEKWLEVSSVSNFETFQSNRLKLRFKDTDGKNKLVHTLNGSALALPRILAAILENYQTEKGIDIPDVLVPYCGFETI